MVFASRVASAARRARLSRMPRRPDLVTPLVLALVAALAVAGYLVFPWALRIAQHEACIARGQMTDC